MALIHLADLIKTARLARGITTVDLARRIGVDRRTVAKLEQGDASVSFGVFLQVLSVFELLKGLPEFLSPENDAQASLIKLRTLRLKKKPPQSISDHEVDF